MPYQPSKPIFVLWRELFDENATVTFVTTLRQRGLRVYLVGLSGISATGQGGLMINADRTLGQVQHLVAQTLCVISPCDLASFLQADNDPRLVTFLDDAANYDVHLVFNSKELLMNTRFAQRATEYRNLSYYETHDLQEFADELATRLLSTVANT